MADIKLSRLPERVPIKLSVTMPPDLNQTLLEYAKFYAESYGREEPVAELIPFMLASFMENDRAFARARGRLGPAASKAGGAHV